MTAWLHFGCGQNLLPAPWRNFDMEVDLSERLPFANGSAQFIFAEHVVEHLEFLAGFRFLEEAKRVLVPGGVLRLSFPDVTRLERLAPHEQDKYLHQLRWLGRPVETMADAQRVALTDWGHKSCWTTSMAWPALRAAGFRRARFPQYGVSRRAELQGVDGHHLAAGDCAYLETSIAEGYV